MAGACTPSYTDYVFSLNPTFVDIESPDSRSLLDRARAGAVDAFGELCRIHETRLLCRAMALCGNPAQAEDLAQDTLVEAWKSLHRYNGRCQFFTWLCAILLHRHCNVVRKRRPATVSTFTHPDEAAARDLIANVAGHDSGPDEAALLREQAAMVQQCVRALPPKHQQVVYLRFYADDSLEGIAAALGCSVGTVKSRLFHALEKLRGMNALHTHFPNPKTKAGSL